MLLGFPLDIKPAAINTYRSRMWEHHLGRVQAALSGSSKGGRAGAMVARVQEELLHSLLLGVLTLPKAIMISLKRLRI